MERAVDLCAAPGSWSQVLAQKLVGEGEDDGDGDGEGDGDGDGGRDGDGLEVTENDGDGTTRLGENENPWRVTSGGGADDSEVPFSAHCGR